MTLTTAVAGANGVQYGIPGVLAPEGAPPLSKDVLLIIFRESNLDLNDFKNIRLLNKAHKTAADEYLTDVESKYTFGRRVDAAANRFMDRPLWQKVCIVAFVTLTSPVSVPVLLVVKSPKIYAKYRDSHILPFVRTVANTIEKTARFVNEWVFTPVAHVVNKVATAIFVTFPRYVNKTVITPAYTFVKDTVIRPVVDFAKTYIIPPTVAAIKKLARAVFVTFPLKALEHVIIPSLRQIARVYNIVVPPIAKVVKAVAKALFITLPLKTIEHVVIPAFRALRTGYNLVVSPVVQAIKIIAKAVLITVPLKVVEHVLLPIGKIVTTKVIIPSARVVATVAKALLITLPLKVYENVISPVARMLAKGISIAYSTAIKPVAQLVISVASKVLFEVIPAIWSPIANAVLEVGHASVDFGRYALRKIL
ncbi:MAG: hypothetical protein JSR37_04345 [Verrucomicrobia bacterium]|nr:hypothetical protein [Verrucomicrobiota bacterium]